MSTSFQFCSYIMFLWIPAPHPHTLPWVAAHGPGEQRGGGGVVAHGPEERRGGGGGGLRFTKTRM